MARTPPRVTERTEAYWRGGAHGTLQIARCQSCGHWLHPPQPVCPSCHGMSIEPEPVSGRGTVWSWTINRYRWSATLEPPYIVAEIELAEQPGLLVLSTVVDCDEVSIGMPVRVDFDHVDDVWIPVFRP